MIDGPDDMHEEPAIRCSNCGGMVPQSDFDKWVWNFCPVCGCKMEDSRAVEHGRFNGGDYMTQKQFIKQLMSHGVSYSDACGLVAYMKELRQLIEKHEDVVMLADANTMQFVPAKVYSYEETFQRMQEGRDIFC